MVKEIERAGIPVAQICTMVNVATGMGATRVIPSRSVLYPTGDPNKTREEEFKLRKQLVSCAIAAVQTDVNEPTVFDITLAPKVNV